MNHCANTFDVIIAGAGPAGCSAAIHLAANGVSVLLAEQKRFPRPKLCGEFISAECWNHFARLGVAEGMIASGGAVLRQTVFYSRGGHSVRVPSEWFGSDADALGLSRAEMDNNLLKRARACGVTVLEDAQACGLVMDESAVRGVSLRTARGQIDYLAGIIIDATGRTRALARRLDHLSNSRTRSRPALVAFKAHLKNARVEADTCEIYSYPGGYGGLNAVEGNVSNLCFIVSAKDVRRCESDPERLVREVVSKNSRAAYALKGAKTETAWLGVSLEGFGRRTLAPTKGLLTAGDAASFIDPFTGSGMLMALESGELVAETIVSHLNKVEQGRSFDSLTNDYRRAYAAKFDARLRTCSFLRLVAFVPQLAEAAIFFFSSDWLRRRLTRATRKGTHEAGQLHADQKLSI